VPILVLDGSITVSWFVSDETSSSSLSILDLAASGGAAVPDLWRIEVGNALLMAERRGRIAPSARIRAIAALGELQIDVDRETYDRAWAGIFSLAERFRLTLYDAAYLDLASRTRLPLASLDRELRKAAVSLGVAVLPED